MTNQTLIQDLRDSGLTQKQIADEIGCSQSAVHAWENEDRGAKRGISGNYLLKLIALHKKTINPKARKVA